MKYIVCNEPGKLSLKEKPAPVRAKGEALLKVKNVGICGTDLHAYSGNQPYFKYPRILGHELATVVLEIDENPLGINVGDKVIVIPYLSCGNCIACTQGKPNCCAYIKVIGVHIDGGMQEQITVPVNNLLPARDLSYKEMVLAEPLSIGAHAIFRAGVKPKETMIVVGCGPIGIGIMKLGQLAGAKVIAMDINESRLQFAKREIGVDYILNSADNTLMALEELTQGDLATVVFDATGHKGALEAGHQYMSHGGRYVLVGLSNGSLNYSHPAIHAKETTILCSRNATHQDFEYVLKVLRNGDFPVDSFVTHRVDFREMVPHFDNWIRADSGIMKAIVDF